MNAAATKDEIADAKILRRELYTAGAIRDARNLLQNLPRDGRMMITELCYLWNWATNPAVLRTDREHAALMLLARRVNRELTYRRKFWDEMPSSGSRYPKYS